MYASCRPLGGSYLRVGVPDEGADVWVHAVLRGQRGVRRALQHQPLEQRHVEVVPLAALHRQRPAVHLGTQLLVVANLRGVAYVLRLCGEGGNDSVTGCYEKQGRCLAQGRVLHYQFIFKGHTARIVADPHEERGWTSASWKTCW